MKTISSPKSVSLLIALLTAFVLMLLIPQQSQAATSTTRAVLTCHGASAGTCSGSGGVGKATARGTVTSNSYTPRTSTFVFDSRKKIKMALSVTVAVHCKSNLAGSDATHTVKKTFTKVHNVNKGRNVKMVSGKKMTCPSGFKVQASKTNVFFMGHKAAFGVPTNDLLLGGVANLGEID